MRKVKPSKESREETDLARPADHNLVCRADQGKAVGCTGCCFGNKGQINPNAANDQACAEVLDLFLNQRHAIEQGVISDSVARLSSSGNKTCAEGQCPRRNPSLALLDFRKCRNKELKLEPMCTLLWM
eukprot:1144964-Pelagomonas_calceolata.AAC.8